MARDFAGGASTDRVNIGSAAQFDNVTILTWTAWFIEIADAGFEGYIIGKRNSSGNGKRVSRFGANISFIVDTTETSPLAQTSDFDLDVWQFIGVTWNGIANAPRMWRGVPGGAVSEVSYISQNGGTGSLVSEAAFGAGIGNIDQENRCWRGSIADVRWFDEEIADPDFLTSIMYGKYARGTDPNSLIGWWPINGSSTEPDWSGNGNNGTVTGTTISDNPPIGPTIGFDD